MRFPLTLLFVLSLCTCTSAILGIDESGGLRAQTTLTPQPGCIIGTVTDADNDDPLIGAAVLITGTSYGCATDLDGNFRLCQLVEGDTVRISVFYTGYSNREAVAVLGGPPVNVRLVPGEGLEEVVVIGYGVSRKRDMTGSVSSISRSNRRTRVKAYRTARRSDPIKPGSYNKIVANGFVKTADQRVSTLSTDVDRAAYANVRGFLNRGQLPPVDAVRVEEMINYFPYERPELVGTAPIDVRSEMMSCPWQPKNQLLRVVAQTVPPAVPDEVVHNLVFLVDVSGSMSSAAKLPLVKRSLRMLTRQLGAKDRLSIVVYAGAAGLVLPPTVGTDTTAIFGALDRLSSGGSTAGAAGIRLAYATARANFVAGGNNRIVIATDGDFNVGISSQKELIKLIEQERESGVFLSVLGFGTGNYQEGMMQELADRGNGNHGYIDGPQEARKLLVEEFNGTIRTVAKDVKAQIEFDPAYVAAYRLIGYENRLLNEEDFDDDKKDAAEMGEGHQVTILYELIPTEAFENATYCGTVKVRYKPAEGGRSQKLQLPLKANRLPDELAATDLRWAAAVAEFGMLLRQSKHAGSSSWPQLLELARSGRGADPGGYRTEMIGLIEKASAIVARR